MPYSNLIDNKQLLIHFFYHLIQFEFKCILWAFLVNFPYPGILYAGAWNHPVVILLSSVDNEMPSLCGAGAWAVVQEGKNNRSFQHVTKGDWRKILWASVVK